MLSLPYPLIKVKGYTLKILRIREDVTKTYKTR